MLGRSPRSLPLAMRCCLGGLLVFAAASHSMPSQTSIPSSGRLAFSHVAAPCRGIAGSTTRDPRSCGVLARGALASRAGLSPTRSLLARDPRHRPLRLVGDGLRMSKGEGAGFSWGGVVELKVVCVDDGSGTGICPDTLSDLLVEMGALSASVEDADYGTPDESPIFDEPGEQVWRAMRDQVKLWKRSRVTALFSSDEDIDNILNIVKDSFELDEVPEHSIDKIDMEKDWVTEVQQNWPPIVVGSLLLRFPWHTEEDLDKARSDAGVGKDVMELTLEGGMAFGTGEHATTKLCCGWLQRVVTRGSRVLDYGAGSGILGMASLRFGALSSVGVDIDRDSILAAESNGRANGLDSKFRCYIPSSAADDPSESDLIPGLGRPGYRNTGDLIERIPSDAIDFDITVANILSKPLMSLSPEISRLTAPGGLLGMSGVLVDQAPDVISVYSATFDDLKVEASSPDGWCLITGKRKA